MSTESTSDDDVEDAEERTPNLIQRQWFPRDILRQTNWLYRVDALRVSDLREMELLWHLTSRCEAYATQFVVWAYSIKALVQSSIDSIIISKLESTLTIITKMIEMFWSEGYCYFLDFLKIAYYPVTNRFTGGNSGPRFPTTSRQKIRDMGHNEAIQLTGFSTNQLIRLFKQLRIPNLILEPGRYQFTGEEATVHYIYNRLGHTKLQMSENYFGGDPRRFTYSIRLIGNHIYETFYHKISGDSMRQWVYKIPEFQYAIWDKLRNGATVEETEHNGNVASRSFIFWGIPLNSFRISGFLDDTGFRTTALDLG